MPISGPWYITTTAVLDYGRLTGRPVREDDTPALDRLAVELERICAETVARYEVSGATPRPQTSGGLLYRVRKPRELGLVVRYDGRVEGDAPQLVAVVPGFGGGR